MLLLKNRNDNEEEKVSILYVSLSYVSILAVFDYVKFLTKIKTPLRGDVNTVMFC